VRTLLLDYLEREEPALLLKVQKALHALLQHNQPPKDSVAWQEHQMTMAFNEWLFIKDSARRKELEQQIASLIASGVEPDFTVIKHLKRERTPLDFVVPDTWKKYLHQQGYTALGLKDFWKDVFYWALPLWAILAGFLAFWPLEVAICEGEKLLFMQGEEELELCIDSQADQILVNEHRARRLLEEKEYELLEVLIRLKYDPDSSNIILGDTSMRQITIGIRNYGAGRDSLSLPDSGGLSNILNTTSPEPENDVRYFWSLLSEKDYQLVEDTLTKQALDSFRIHLAADYYNLGATLHPTLEAYSEEDSIYIQTRDSVCYFFEKAYDLDIKDDTIQYAYNWCQTPLQRDTLISEEINPAIDTAEASPRLPEIRGRRVYAPETGTYIIIEDQSTESLETIQWDSIAADSIRRIVQQDSLPTTDKDSPTASRKGNAGAWFLNDKQGEVLAIIYCDTIGAFRGNIAPFKREGLWGFIDTSGTEVISPQFDSPGIPKPKMVTVPGGSFQMGDTFGDGSEDERPVHEVELNSFQMATTETTFEAYDLFCRATGRTLVSDIDWGRVQRPIINVSWYDAVEYCNWLSIQHGLQLVYRIDKTKKDPNNSSGLDDVKWTVQANWAANGYRLPTEAEWEYAAKGGPNQDSYRYSGSDSLDVVAWYTANSDRKTHLVGQKQANSLGLYDLSGNVWEWCWDWYGEDYYQQNEGDKRNPRGPVSGDYRVVRGGSWYYSSNFCRCSDRSWINADFRDFYTGFRVLRYP
ncbi:MAG: SUMF1/EgtB/PvdO family nonheme iron enzyme, partial [Bacteroidota bacterium]